MRKQYLERLSQVVRVLEELPRGRKLDLDNWMCGTTACACGWAGTDPWFIKRGFKTIPLPGEFIKIYLVHYKDMNGVVAGKEFFGLDSRDFSYLFMGYRYPMKVTKRQVISRIKSYIKDHTGEPREARYRHG